MNYYFQSIEQTLKNLDSSLDGLSSYEAKKKLTRDGKNVLAQKKKRPAILRFLNQFKDVLIAVLIVSCVVSLVIGSIEHSINEFIDAGIIFGVVLINAVIGFIQEQKSQKAMESLKNMTKPYCKVLRNNRFVKIKTEDVVVGDIVLLEAGDVVPADLRLVETNSLKIEESSLTGESVPVEKDASAMLLEGVALADRITMAYMGSVVVYGRGLGVVVATSQNSEIGKIAVALSEMDDQETPLTKRLRKTSFIITSFVISVCLLIFIVQVTTVKNVFSAFSMAIAIAVCAIPEGLPACNTVTLSIGVKRMSDAHAIVKTLPSVETLGSTEVICSDKTGTLTLNKMTVQKIFYMGDSCQQLNKTHIQENVSGDSVDNVLTLDTIKKQKGEFDRNFSELLRCMLLCNDTKVMFEDEKLHCIGDPTEIALVHYGYEMGRNKENFEGKYQRLNEIPFDSNRKMMSVFSKVDNKICLYTKGALDSVLSRCDRILENGKIRKITQKDKEEITEKNSEFASLALRNLAFAFKFVEKIGKPTSENSEKDLCFLGLVGMMDPPREEVKSAIVTCKQAGIKTIMITGDHKDTAFAIAKELGICSKEENVITGSELDAISDKDFYTLVNKYQVYARVSPEHKVRIVKALKENDKVVAMTGDGVNDAPSIKSADIGVGMGITGTDVTKEVSDIILTDDNFATIVGAVKEGRRIYNTILKLLIFMLGTSLAELILLTVISLCFRDEQFFTPALLLWINFVSDTFMGFGLGFENAEPNIMKQKPVKNSGNLFKGQTGIKIFTSAMYVFLCSLTLYCVCKFCFKFSPLETTTICFLYICVTEQLETFNLKNINDSLFAQNPFNNKILNICFVVSFLLTILIVAIPMPTIQTALGLSTISWWQWLLALGSALLIIPFAELNKLLTKVYRKVRAKHEKK